MIKYNHETRWIEVTDPEVDLAAGALVMPRGTWDRIVSSPHPVIGIEVQRLGKVYRLGAAIAAGTVVLAPTTASFPLREFREIPPPAPMGQGPFLYLGVSGSRDADGADAARLVGSWGLSPERVRTGWDVSDEVMRRVPGITRAQMWPYWIRMVQDSTEVLIVPVDVDLGRATVGVLEKCLVVGRRVVSAEPQPRRVVRIAHGRAHPESSPPPTGV